MRPIYWGVTWFFIGMVGWFFFGVIVELQEALGEVNPLILALVYVFGALFFFSLPIAIVVEIVRWRRRRRAKAE